MSFYWVNHKQTFRSELNGGYIWSPMKNRNGSKNESYLNLPRTKPGDILFSYASGVIAAIGVIDGPCLEWVRPLEFGRVGEESWNPNGWKVPVEWNLLTTPFIPKHHIEEIAPLLADKYAPIQQNGNGNQGTYLAHISSELGTLILTLAGHENTYLDSSLDAAVDNSLTDQEEVIINSDHEDETEKAQLIKARKGQGRFRISVGKIEKNCRVTGVDQPFLLIASHVKPWKVSTNAERLDGNNGLMLSPHIDRLFDRGWISFENNGSLKVSPMLAMNVLSLWNIDPEIQARAFSNNQAGYLEYHREEVLKK